MEPISTNWSSSSALDLDDLANALETAINYVTDGATNRRRRVMLNLPVAEALLTQVRDYANLLRGVRSHG